MHVDAKPEALMGEVDVEALPFVSFAMEQSGVPLVRLRVHNRSQVSLSGARVELQLVPELGEVQSIPVPDLDPGESSPFATVDYRLPPGRLRSVIDSERAQWTWSLHHEGTVLARGSTATEVTPFNHWPGPFPEGLLSCFVTPGHPVVAQVLLRVRERLRASTGDAGLEGYQSRSPERVRAVLAAIYETIQSFGITYVGIPATFEKVGQKVRLPDALLSEQMGCCLDISLLVAACAEQAGLRPLLVIVQGHAFPAVWLAEDRFPEGIVDDVARLRNQVALGQILAFDSSTTVSTPRKPFDEAIRNAQAYLADDPAFRYAIDVAVARAQGFRPLPLRAVVVEPEPEAVTETSSPERAVTRQILVEAARQPPPAEPPAPEPPPAPVAARFRRWQERLLDLTRRNKLLNFRPDGRGAIPLVVGNLGAFEDRLAADQELELSPLPDKAANDLRDAGLVLERLGAQAIEEQLAKELAAGIVRTACSGAELAARFKNLDRGARLSLEEGGANTLYVTIGLLRFAEPGGEWLAPLLLYPASLKLDRRRGRIKLRRLGEDPIVNFTLLEKLRRDLGVEIEPLALLEADESGVDVPAMLQAVRAAIQARAGWEVLEQAHVGLFTFTKFLMWKDLEENARDFVENPVVRHIAEKDSRFVAEGREVAPDELDAGFRPAELPCVVDADSTQLAAVASALTGRSFVLQGPPGTGKSQTITNLVAAALARGKTVLFVSEKMAALDVVHRRLVAAGLGDFCLELHSHKSNKKEVLDSLRGAFERGAAEAPPPWEARSGELMELRSALNDYAGALHRPRAIGTTHFGAMNRLLALHGEPELRFSVGRVGEWSTAQLGETMTAVEELATRAEIVEPVASHPWKLADPPPWTARLDEEIREALGDVLEALDEVEEHAATVSGALGLGEPLSTARLDALARTLALCRESPPPDSALSEDWPQIARRGRTVLEAREEDARRRAALAVRWSPELLALELSPLRAQFDRWAFAFFLLAWWFLRAARKRLAPLAQDRLPPSKTIAADLAEAQKSREAAAGLDAEVQALASALAPRWSSDRGDEDLARALAAGQAVFDAASGLDAEAAEAVRRAQSLPDPTPLAAALRRLADAERRLAQAAGAGAPAAWPPTTAPEHRARLREVAGGWSAAASRFRDFCQYRAATRRVEALGLDALAGAHAAGALPSGSLVPAFSRRLWAQVVATVRDAEPALRAFEGEARDRLIERFGAADRAHLELSRAWVVTQLEAKLPAVGAAAAESSEPGILGRELRKKARHLPIRKLLAALPNLLPRLKPCLLMSPLSIAQYLPAAGRRFDLVVFDEASQIGTHDAIGAIARGEQVIVVGDSKQLPPTTFFTRRGEEEEGAADENDQEELESVLEELLAKGLPQQMLGWHYRSRHDSLIDFSNRHFYAGKLHVFPAAARAVEGLGVSWHPVPNGVYHSGAASQSPRTNPLEAQALVAHLVGSLRSHRPGERTFGVVTFGITQQELIQDLLDAERLRFPEIEEHFAGDEAVFVKNLETVQGDERDEILFSIGYARDEHGKLRMHFGPLSLAGGERRLNVAITRARRQLRVFSTLTPDQIDLGRTGADGARLLREFLEFASRQPVVAGGAGAQVAGPEATVVAELRGVIEAMGHAVHERIGCGGYRIDLGVVSPDRPGAYALGIETDGPAYASARTARDRDRLRGQVLSSLGWRMHRVWTPDWLRDRPRETERLARAIDAALAERRAMAEGAARSGGDRPRPREQAPSATDPLPTPVPEVAPPEAPVPSAASAQRVPTSPPVRPYQLARLEAVSDDPSSLYAPSSDRALEERVAIVVEAESPIHVDELCRRVIACFGVQRLSARAKRRVAEALESLSVGGAIAVEGPFIWSGPQRASFAGFRGPSPDGAGRDLTHVAPDEIANAARWVLSQNLSLARADLARETARLFGVSRLGKNVLAAIDAGIDLLVERRECSVDGDRLTSRS